MEYRDNNRDNYITYSNRKNRRDMSICNEGKYGNTYR